MTAEVIPLPERPTTVRWTVLTLACGSSWLLYFHRYVFALIKPELAQEWDLDTNTLGLLDATFFAGYTFPQLPLGVLGDLAGVRIVLSAMILVWSIGLALHALAPSTAVLHVARGMLGVGQSGVFASLSRITKTWFRPTIRSKVQGLIGVFFARSGGLSAYLLFGPVLVALLGDWRSAVYLLASIGIVQSILFFVLFRNSPHQHAGVNSAEALLIEGDEPPPELCRDEMPKKPTYKELFRRMSPRSILNVAALNVQSILSTIADNMYSNWIPLFLAQVYGFNTKQLWLSALPLLGGAIGGVVGGWLNDHFIVRTGNRRWSRTCVALIGKGLAAITLLVALLTAYDKPYWFCGMLFFVKLFGDWSLTTSWGVVTDIGGKATASVFAFNNSVAGIGAMLAASLYGFLVKYYNNDWTVMFKIACATYALCALSWLFINCTIPIVGDDCDETGQVP